MTAEKLIIDYISDQDDDLSRMAMDIWDHPQIAMQETYASKLQAKDLEADGFTIEWGAGGMETAFVATGGSGDPIIGFLGEYDALPGLSQTVSAEGEAIVPGGPGHGCGHYLFGT
ncbi:MAG: amidohydrolase, partial [Gemmatimonadetes bacterium]|nr:amidohydrolase [Gemmatimonadota bacterium]